MLELCHIATYCMYRNLCCFSILVSSVGALTLKPGCKNTHAHDLLNVFINDDILFIL